MTKKTTPNETSAVTCEVCLTEIPESVAVSSEGDEYTQHFCGIECYNKWRNRENKPQENVVDKKDD